jgi:hypothetical protein
MSNFLLLYSGGSMPTTEAEQKAVIEAWTAWYTGLGEAVVDPGNPFTPMAKSVSSDGKVHDGPAGSMASGYTIIKAGSLDAAAAMARGCPVLAGGAQITVYETFPVM